MYSLIMKISFHGKLNKTLNNESSIKKNYGNLANKICIRLSLLEVAEKLSDIPDVPPTRRHKLKGRFEGCWAIDIEKNWRLVLKPDKSSETEVNEITEITIIDIVDYH